MYVSFDTRVLSWRHFWKSVLGWKQHDLFKFNRREIELFQTYTFLHFLSFGSDFFVHTRLLSFLLWISLPPKTDIIFSLLCQHHHVAPSTPDCITTTTHNMKSTHLEPTTYTTYKNNHFYAHLPITSCLDFEWLWHLNLSQFLRFWACFCWCRSWSRFWRLVLCGMWMNVVRGNIMWVWMFIRL